MNDLNKIKNIAEKIKLSPQEKESAKANILNFIRFHPVSKPDTARLLNKGSFFNLFNLNLKPMPAFLSILFILGVSGGASLAAESALPGDLLYPVKVGINEEVRAVVSFSAETKANWDTRRLERRLEEAEKLAHKKEFNAEARANIEKNFEAHAERVEKRITEFESKGKADAAADLSSNFEVSLGAHERILTKIDGEEVNKFLPKVRAKKGSAALLRVKMEARVSDESSTKGKSAAEGRGKSAKHKIVEIKAFIEKIRMRLGAEATADAEARLEEAQKVWAEGKMKVDTKAYGEAFVLFQRAHRIAQEAKLLIEAKSRLDVDFEAHDKDDEDKDDEDIENHSKKNNDREKRPSSNIDAELDVEVESESRIDADDNEAENRGKGNLDIRFDLGL